MKPRRLRESISSKRCLRAATPENTWTPLPLTPKLCLRNQICPARSVLTSAIKKSSAGQVGGRTPVSPEAAKCVASSPLSSNRCVNSWGNGRINGRAVSADPDAGKSPALRTGQQNAGIKESSSTSTRCQPFMSINCNPCLCIFPSGLPQPQVRCLPCQYTLPKVCPEVLVNANGSGADCGGWRRWAGTRRVQASATLSSPSRS
mmetsp:Transcript_72371/g.182577  ORF Transcript_72371/g.182577 Transcript_72371/m.182577 type:complete len:204 (+) Transcript_72371:585-1196(+)